MKIRNFVCSVAVFLFLPLFAQAGVFELATPLTPGAEVPPVTGAAGASGNAIMAVDDDTGAFTWFIDFRGLTGPAVGGHFHAAAAGSNGDIVLNLADGTDAGQNGSPVFDAIISFSGIGSTRGVFAGSATLDANAVASILTEGWYVNIHTGNNPTGEIRGQVVAGSFTPVIPVPAAAWLFLSGLAGLFAIKRRPG